MTRNTQKKKGFFDNIRFKSLANASLIDLNINLYALRYSISSTDKPFYNFKSKLLLSLAIIPSIIRLIKSAICFALVAPLCVLTLGRYTNLNYIALYQFTNIFLSLARVITSLFVPLIRLYNNINKKYSSETSSERNEQDQESIRSEEQYRVTYTWDTKAPLFGESKYRAYLLSEFERKCFGFENMLQ